MKLSALFVALAVSGIGFAGYVLLSPQSRDAGGSEFTELELEVVTGEDPAEIEAFEEALAEAGRERVEGDTSPAPTTSGDPVRATLALEGRVVDPAGTPIAGAEVTVSMRRSLAALLREGRGFGRGDRNRLRDQFRRRRIPAVTTDRSGRFAIRAPAFDQTSLQLAVTHATHAPNVVDREWKAEQGSLEVGDIVLTSGATVFGVAVDKQSGAPLAGTEIRWEPSGERRGGREPDARRGQPEPRGEGRQRGQQDERGRGGRFGRGERSRALAQLVGTAKTDDHGAFELRNLPAGSFRLNAEREKYLPGQTGTLQAEDDKRVDAGRIELALGAELVGIVRNEDGKPVFLATVRARASFAGLGERLGRGRDNGTPGAQPNGTPNRDPRAQRGRRGSRERGGQPGSGAAPTAPNPEGSRRERRGRERRGGQPGAAGLAEQQRRAERQQQREQLQSMARLARVQRETRTAKDGTFVLDALPHLPLVVTVEHQAYADEKREPVEVAQTPRLEIKVYRKLAVAGVVVDAATNRPIELYGIAARRIDERGGRRGGFGERGGLRELLQGARDGRGGAGFGRGGRGERGGTRGFGRGSRGERGATPVPRTGGTTPAPGGNGTGTPPQRGRGGRGPGGRAPNPEREAQRQAERQQREAQRVAAQAEREAYLKRRLGPSGVAPRLRPEPEKHPNGAFRLTGLQPGRYVFDVVAPGYAKVAAGPAELELSKEAPPVRVALARGAVISGQVLSAQTNEPIAGARIELLLPPPPANGGPSSGRGDRGLRVDGTRTDAEGKFQLSEQKAGSYRVAVDARDHLRKVEENVSLGAGGRELTLRIDRGGRVFGTVRGVKPGERLQVIATKAEEPNETRNARIGDDGSYELRNLEPGGYHVHVADSSGRRRGFGRRGGRGGFGRGGRFGQQAPAATPEGAPDVWVRAGTEHRYDLDATKKLHAIVKGTVFRNGEPARGVEIRLQQKVEAATGQNEGRRGLGRGGRRGGSTLSDRTDSDGAFEIEEVAPGTWILEIRESSGRGGFGRGGRGGRRGFGGSLHREEIQLAEGAVYERQLAFTFSEATVKVRDAKTGEAVDRVLVSMVLAAEAAGKEPRAWRDLPSLRVGRTRDGVAKIANLVPGVYSYTVFGRGVTAKTGTLSVGASAVSAELAVERQEPGPDQNAEQGRRGAERRGGNTEGTLPGGRTRGGGSNPGGRRGNGGNTQGGRGNAGTRGGRQGADPSRRRR